MKDRIGWKVVSRGRNGVLTSAIIGRGSPWCATYVVGRPTTGRAGTPVFAFRTREQARRFAVAYQLVVRAELDTLVVKAELDNPRTQRKIATYYAPQGFSHFWESKDQSRYSSDSPAGTLVCDAITLLPRGAK